MAQDILIVDDEADIRYLTAGILGDEGYDTREAADSQAALAAVEIRRPSLILLDIWLQGSDLDGLGILQAVKSQHPSLPVVMMSGHGTVETAVSAIKDGAYDFVEKPFKADRLLLVVRRAIEAARLTRENEDLRRRAGTDIDLIGESGSLRQLRQTIERVAPTNSRVLISGPAGSGKEVVARQLHALSRRQGGPFVVLNSATMLAERMEMELFGIEASPDDTNPRKTGTFEAAHNGTLFLDEVADMPLETQGKIVRVLQEQIFERVGGTTPVKVDVRVIAATTRDLQQEIADGRFRQDLFYRLNVVPIEVPSLAHRREDIPMLAQFYMDTLADALGRPPRPLGDDTLTRLQGHDWPGNVRELRNIIERLLITAPGSADAPITADMLPGELAGHGTAASNGGADVLGLSMRDARESFERDYLSAQIDRFGGNISRTAEFVGMERSALHRKLKSLGVTDGPRGRR